MGCHNNQVYRYSGTCNHPFIMIIIMIMSLAGVAVSRAALLDLADLPRCRHPRAASSLCAWLPLLFQILKGKREREGRER